MIKKFRTKWKDFRFVTNYFDKQYFTPKQQAGWMFAHRQSLNYRDTNTNNFIESFHNVLKRKFLNNRMLNREDYLIYKLLEKALPYYQGNVMSADAGAVGRRTAGQRRDEEADLRAQIHMDTMRKKDPNLDLCPMIRINAFRVTSFQCLSATPADPPVPQYEVKYDFERRRVQSCTCPHFLNYRMKCKHIALVLFELDNPFRFEVRVVQKNQRLLCFFPYNLYFNLHSGSSWSPT